MGFLGSVRTLYASPVDADGLLGVVVQMPEPHRHGQIHAGGPPLRFVDHLLFFAFVSNRLLWCVAVFGQQEVEHFKRVTTLERFCAHAAGRVNGWLLMW